jgi:membrane protein DedA with SNARE-associated domain
MTTSILAPVIAWIISLVSSLGYAGIIIAMMIESASIPLPSEIIMGISGYLVYKGEMNLILAALAGAVGNVIGSTIMYYLGSKGGRPIIKRYGKFLHITDDKFDKVDKWFEKFGDKFVFVSQLLPVIRTFVSLPAGILRIKFSRFIFYTFTGAFIWCLALAYVSSLFGEQWEKIADYLKPFEYFIIFAILAAVAYYFIRIIYHRKRREINKQNANS